MVDSLGDALLTLLYPPICLLCGARGDQQRDLCPACSQNLPGNQHACPRCAASLPDTVPVGVLCGECQSQPPPFDYCYAPFCYQQPITQLIAEFKFHGHLTNGRLLGNLLADSLSMLNNIERPQLLIPVPLHRQRLRERGFNQALELAWILRKRLRIAVAPNACKRILLTPPQAGLSARERRTNLKGAFRVEQKLKVEHLVLIDDVMTTGSTVAEIARQLKQQGVQQIGVWVIARTRFSSL